jgi:hypothetical protein
MWLDKLYEKKLGRLNKQLSYLMHSAVLVKKKELTHALDEVERNLEIL